jgi:hypothetical protein
MNAKLEHALQRARKRRGRSRQYGQRAKVIWNPLIGHWFDRSDLSKRIG